MTTEDLFKLEAKRLETWSVAVSSMTRTCGKEHKEEAYQYAKDLADTMADYFRNEKVSVANDATKGGNND